MPQQDQNEVMAEMTQEMYVSLRRLQDEHLSNVELARVLECQPDEAQDTILNRKESHIWNYSRYLGIDDDAAYEQLERAYIDSLYPNC